MLYTLARTGQELLSIEDAAFRENLVDFEGWEQLRPVFEQVKSDLVVVNCHSHSSRIREVAESAEKHPDLQYITFWGIHPDLRQDSCSVHMVNGIRIPSGARDGLAVPELQTGRFMDKEGVVLGYVEGNLIWVCFDLPHWYDPKAAEILQYIFSVAKVGELQKVKPINMYKALQTGVKACRDTALNEAQRRVTTTKGQYELFRKQLKGARHKVPLQKTLKAEVEKVGKLKGVKEVAITRNGVTITTDVLYIPWEGERRKLGAYKFTLRDMEHMVFYPAGQNRISDYIHPHISMGIPCLPHECRLFSGELYYTGKWGTLTELVMSFLGTYTPGNAYLCITRWPVAKPEKVAPVAVPPVLPEEPDPPEEEESDEDSAPEGDRR